MQLVDLTSRNQALESEILIYKDKLNKSFNEHKLILDKINHSKNTGVQNVKQKNILKLLIKNLFL